MAAVRSGDGGAEAIEAALKLARWHTGRPRAVYRKFGICRICFRNLAHKGQIPGVVKASW